MPQFAPSLCFRPSADWSPSQAAERRSPQFYMGGVLCDSRKLLAHGHANNRKAQHQQNVCQSRAAEHSATTTTKATLFFSICCCSARPPSPLSTLIPDKPSSPVTTRHPRQATMARRCLALAAPLAVLAAALLAAAAAAAAAPDSWLHEHFTTDGRVHVHHDSAGRQVASLILDRSSGAGFTSKDKFLFGEFSVQMRLIPGNSAGTVTSFYLTSGEGPEHDEIDMEFMGNSSGSPVVLNTNVWAHGDGKKEHQFDLWFDPGADFHTYTVVWNPKNIIFQVDGVTVRAFPRYADLPYPNAKPMRVHATLWDGSYWATLQGNVTVDWSRAPFAVSYRAYSADACVAGAGAAHACDGAGKPWMGREPGETDRETIAWAARNLLRYNYCADGWRFPKGFPGECARNS
ncbi:hypothetical protein ACP4OV_030653 [Aristida adscensionis]